MARLSAGIRVFEIEGRRDYKAAYIRQYQMHVKSEKRAATRREARNRRVEDLPNAPTWPRPTARKPITVIFVRRAHGACPRTLPATQDTRWMRGVPQSSFSRIRRWPSFFGCLGARWR